MTDCGNVKKVFVPPEKGTTPPEKPPIKGVGITDLAAQKIVHFAQTDKKDPQKYGLKITVVKDGCSGNSYSMELSKIAEAKKNGDKIFTKNGATIIVEKLSYMFLIGSELDYAETLLMSGFQLQNPNVKKSCSCGSSFAV